MLGGKTDSLIEEKKLFVTKTGYEVSMPRPVGCLQYTGALMESNCWIAMTDLCVARHCFITFVTFSRSNFLLYTTEYCYLDPRHRLEPPRQGRAV